MYPFPETDGNEDITSGSHTKFLSSIETTYIDTDIDMRREIYDMCKNHGHWIILRKYDTTKRSAYWDERTHSAIGGPAWEYTDIFIKSIFSREGLGVLPTAATRTIRLGQMDSKDSVYYLPYYVDPTDKDLIITINPCEGYSKPSYYKILQAKKIARVDSMRDKYGRVEFHQVVVVDNTPTGDVTLE